MLFCLGSLIGLIFLYLFCGTKIFEEKDFFKIIYSFILVSYFLFIVYNYTNLMHLHEKVEENTKIECNEIKKHLQEYEKNNNITLTNIAICSDSEVTYMYNSSNNMSALCIRPLAVEWGDDGAINYYTNMNLKEIEMPKEIYDKYFLNKNWDELNVEEQFICIGETVYYCIY